MSSASAARFAKVLMEQNGNGLPFEVYIKDDVDRAEVAEVIRSMGYEVQANECRNELKIVPAPDAVCA